MAKFYIFSVILLYTTTNALADKKQDLNEGIKYFTKPYESSTALGNDAMLFMTNPDEDMPERWDSLSAIKLILERMPQALQIPEALPETSESFVRTADSKVFQNSPVNPNPDIFQKNLGSLTEDIFQLNAKLATLLPIPAVDLAYDLNGNDDTSPVVVMSEGPPVTFNMQKKEKKTFRFRKLGPEPVPEL